MHMLPPEIREVVFKHLAQLPDFETRFPRLCMVSKEWFTELGRYYYTDIDKVLPVLRLLHGQPNLINLQKLSAFYTQHVVRANCQSQYVAWAMSLGVSFANLKEYTAYIHCAMNYTVVPDGVCAKIHRLRVIDRTHSHQQQLGLVKFIQKCFNLTHLEYDAGPHTSLTELAGITQIDRLCINAAYRSGVQFLTELTQCTIVELVITSFHLSSAVDVDELGPIVDRIRRLRLNMTSTSSAENLAALVAKTRCLQYLEVECGGKVCRFGSSPH